ncbi:hypothetical protein BCR44DRAFT_168529 [Catenaria anguillulae PL171]|uniref:Uncharacterized protein n=1 Tax=Catenaria anguillulae PL171 TaxID=765915 RepID=A0A1Y2HEC5_9FUNG|nr:hypothetical protein BCR44DRAFT_168529 [Catenaria anguillulae PL171]
MGLMVWLSGRVDDGIPMIDPALVVAAGRATHNAMPVGEFFLDYHVFFGALRALRAQVEGVGGGAAGGDGSGGEHVRKLDQRQGGMVAAVVIAASGGTLRCQSWPSSRPCMFPPPSLVPPPAQTTRTRPPLQITATALAVARSSSMLGWHPPWWPCCPRPRRAAQADSASAVMSTACTRGSLATRPNCTGLRSSKPIPPSLPAGKRHGTALCTGQDDSGNTFSRLHTGTLRLRPCFIKTTRT